MNTYYLRKFRRLAYEEVYARLAEIEGVAEIVCDSNPFKLRYWSYGCCPNDKELNGIGHFAGYKIHMLDTYDLTNKKEVLRLAANLKEARRDFILHKIGEQRILQSKKENEAYLKRINYGKRIEL